MDTFPDRVKAAGLAGRLAIGAYSHNVLVRGRMDRCPYGPRPFWSYTASWGCLNLQWRGICWRQAPDTKQAAVFCTRDNSGFDCQDTLTGVSKMSEDIFEVQFRPRT